MRTRRHLLIVAGSLGVALSLLSISTGVAQVDPSALPGSKAVDPTMLIGAPLGPPISGDVLTENTEELSSRMRCPVCQALSVADSPSQSAMAIKEEVRGLLAAGYTEAQVIDYFERAYGEFIRLAPKAEGFNLVVWLAPAAAFLVGAGLVAMRLRRRRQPAHSSGGVSDASPGRDGAAELNPNADLSPYLARVREEVGSGS